MSDHPTRSRVDDPNEPCEDCGLAQPCKCNVDWNQPDATPDRVEYRVTVKFDVTATSEQEAIETALHEFARAFGWERAQWVGVMPEDQG